MENTDWRLVKSSTNAPYINQTLLPMSSYGEHYYTSPGVHPSLGNYIWLEAGTNFGIYNDSPPPFNLLSTTNHLVNLMEEAGITWRAYAEGVTGTNCPTSDAYPYAVRHNPFMYFTDVISNETRCVTHVRPYGELAADLSGNTNVAQYNFIIPNSCDDGHDYCNTNGAVWQLDNWLSTEVPKITNAPAFTNNGVVFIVFDEGSFQSDGRLGDGPVPFIILSPLAKGNGYSNDLYYTHSSMVRTIEEIFNLEPFLADAANARDFTDLFEFLQMKALIDPHGADLDLEVSGLIPGRTTVVLWSQDLSTWSELTNFIPTTSTIQIKEPFRAGERLRYYRASIP